MAPAGDHPPLVRGFACGVLLLLTCGCGPDEPVLQGVPPQALLAERPSAADRATGSDADDDAYQRPDGVLVDVSYLGGRPYLENRDVIVDQLGALVSVEPLPGGGGQEMTFERGSLRVENDEIYMIRVPFAEPLRRTDALLLLGFPTQVDRYVILHREYRLNNSWGFRRIRMKRQGEDNELVTQVEAWRRVPGEAAGAR